jgi:DNA-binding transcriptional regulator YhcF (GntR family)
LEQGFDVGGRIPSIKKLADMLNIGKISIQNAVKLLEKDGVLENIPRSGCYVKRVPESKLSEKNLKAYEEGIFVADFIRDPRKKIKIGITPSDLSTFSHLWKKTFLEYMKENPDVNIELVPFNEFELLRESDAEDYPDIVQFPASFLNSFIKTNRIFNLNQLGMDIFDLTDFYPGIAKVVKDEDGFWGAPLVSAGSCLCYNKKYINDIKNIDCGGFWSFLKSSEKLKSKFKSMVNFDKAPSSLMKMAVFRDVYDFNEMKYLKGDDFENFLRQFEPFFQNPKVSAPFFVGAPNVHQSAEKDFYSGQTFSVNWSSSGMPYYLTKCPFDFGVLPVPIEEDCSCDAETVLSCITNSSRYPMECADILKYMASFDVQKFFASEGRMIARMDASKYLKINGLDEESIDNLLSCLRYGIVEKNNSREIGEFTHTVVFYEMRDWQQGKIDVDEFINRVRIKAKYFFKEN